MKKLFIDTNRDGYSTDQCESTMTVKELIECLEQYDGETMVYFRNDSGYTYGSIDEDDINDTEDGDDE